LLLACGAGDVATPRAVAWSGGDTLNAEQLAHLLVLSQPFPLQSEAAADLARHWQQMMALAAANDTLLLAGLRAAAAPVLRDSMVARLRAQRFADARAEAESTAAQRYAEGDLRLIAHVLRRAGADARPEEHEIQRRDAQALHAQLQSGTSWAEANTRNEDSEASTQDGVIGLVTRGELPPPLDSIAFALEPGQFSDVARSAAGFHIIYRPALSTMRAAFVERLADHVAYGQEMQLGGDAALRRNATLRPVATLRVREIALDPWAALNAGDVVGTFDGGVLSAGDLAENLAVRSWDARRALADAPAEARAAFAGRLLVRAVLYAEALAAGVHLAAADSAHALAAVRASIDQLLARARLASLQQGGSDEARVRVDRYMGSIAARHIPMDAPPPALIRVLTRGAGFDASAIPVALPRAQRLLDAAGYREASR
jgi:peptidyl-prolyl cis-trans isomerase D